MLQKEYTQIRQSRLLKFVRENNWEAVVIAEPRHVYYFTTFWTNWLQQSAFVMLADGRTWGVTANKPAQEMTADENAVYEAQWMATQRQEQPLVVGRMVHDFLKKHNIGRVGIDSSVVNSAVAMEGGFEFGAVDEHLFQMRRAKDPDELELIRKAIGCTEAMYARAREIVRPGVGELEVFTELHKAGVMEAGEEFRPQHLGNDFVCGRGGGPPRGGRFAEEGEIYILDLGPAYRGYFSDNCRAFAVGGKPSDAQMKAWRAVVDCFPIVERMARPGARCREIFEAVDEHMKSRMQVGLVHHLGHGFGLQPHEYPHLNPRWDDVLIEGETFTAEPGIYGAELRGGIRIEQDYVVTRDGVESLVKFPLEMV